LRFAPDVYSHPVMIGDNYKDLEAAENAKMHGIYAQWGFSDFKPEKAPMARTPNDVYDILKELL